jgi:hypothetical protein
MILLTATAFDTNQEGTPNTRFTRAHILFPLTFYPFSTLKKKRLIICRYLSFTSKSGHFDSLGFRDIYFLGFNLNPAISRKLQLD